MMEFLTSNLMNGVINLITLIGVVINLGLFIKNRHLANQKISLIFNVNGMKYLSKYPILRKDVSRAEIKGIMNDMLCEGKKTFKIKYLADKNFIENVLNVQKGKGKEIVINCKDDEFNVFDKSNFKLIKDDNE